MARTWDRSLSGVLCAGPAAAEGVSEEAMRHLPSATVRDLEGLPSIDGKKVQLLPIAYSQSLYLKSISTEI